MTTTKTPKTAADARRLADELAAAERDLTQRRAAADKAAQLEEARRQLEHADAVLAPERTRAVAALDAAVVNPAVDLEEIPGLLIAAKIASARRAAAVRAAASVLDALDPLRSPVSGQPIQHRGDLYDQLAQRTLVDVLEDAVRRRASAAEMAATNDVYGAITAAGAAAADAIK